MGGVPIWKCATNDGGKKGSASGKNDGSPLKRGSGGVVPGSENGPSVVGPPCGSDIDLAGELPALECSSLTESVLAGATGITNAPVNAAGVDSITYDEPKNGVCSNMRGKLDGHGFLTFTVTGSSEIPFCADRRLAIFLPKIR